MKTTFFKSLFVFMMVYLLFCGHDKAFAQCTTTTNLLTENFNGYGGAGNDNTAIANYLASKGLNKGQNTKTNWITDNAKSISCMGCGWKGNSANCQTGTIAGVDYCLVCDANSRSTGASGAVGDNAYIIDPALPSNTGTVLCYTATGTFSAGTIFQISADYTSPWCEYDGPAADQDPTIWWTVGGVVVTGTLATVVQWNGTASSGYVTQNCYFTVPAGGMTNPAICMNMCLKNSTTDPGCNGSGGGNDVMVDNVVINTISGGGCTSSGCTVVPTTTTPVELISFSAYSTSIGKSLIQWATASEKNSSHILVEKSFDESNFYEIGKVPASGNYANIRNYGFDDNNFNQSCYYRLKLVDIDGSFTFSNIIFLPLNEGNHVRIINNTSSSEELELKAIVTESCQWNIQVSNVLGQEYMNEQMQLSPGENTLLKRNLSSRNNKELVLCKITGPDGEVIYTGMIFW